jgi:hypothetical protein
LSQLNPRSGEPVHPRCAMIHDVVAKWAVARDVIEVSTVLLTHVKGSLNGGQIVIRERLRHLHPA